MANGAAAGNAARAARQFDRDKLAQMCDTEAAGLREYAQYLQTFKAQVNDQVNSEDRLQEIYKESAPLSLNPATRKGTVKDYLIGNDVKLAGKRRLYELEAAAVRIQRAYRSHRIRRRWLQLITRSVKVGGASDAQTRLVPATLFDSFARSRHLMGAGRNGTAPVVNSRGVPLEERLLTYRRSHELFHGDEFTRW